jgi:hypothetical protein
VVYIYIYIYIHMEKQKTKKKIFRVASPSVWAAALGEAPSVWAAALGEDGVFPSAWAVALEEDTIFPECLGCGSRGRGFLPRVLHSGKNFFFFKKEGNDAGWSPTASILLRVIAQLSEKPSPSARFLALGKDVFPVKRYPGQSFPSVALGEAFPECIWH